MLSISFLSPVAVEDEKLLQTVELALVHVTDAHFCYLALEYRLVVLVIEELEEAVAVLAYLPLERGVVYEAVVACAVLAAVHLTAYDKGDAVVQNLLLKLKE